MHKYVTSKIDNKIYCKKNGQFSRHLKQHKLTYQQYYEQYITGIQEQCPFCDKSKTFYQKNHTYANTCGSKSCAAQYAWNNVHDKSIASQRMTDYWKNCTQTEKSQISAKRKETTKRRYGVNHPMQLPEIKEKVTKTSKEKYGTDYPSQSNIVKEKLRKTFNKKYGCNTYAEYKHLSTDTLAILEDKEKLIAMITRWGNVETAKILNIDVTSFYLRLRKHGLDEYIGNTRSSAELKISELLTSMGVDFVENDRKILAPKELDFYLPKYKTAIEINGLYWHSTASPKNIDKLYHFEKWKQCKEKGITLLSYTDSEVHNKFDIIKSKIKYFTNKNKTIVGARNCTIGQVDHVEEFNLLEKHHMQGKLFSRTGSLGAYYENKLVAIINWAKRKNYLEITRYCCNTNASYPGLFSKMLKACIQIENFSGIVVSFSNNSHSNGNLYKEAGFTQDDILEPAYWYTKDFIVLENRQKFMKSKIAKTFDVDVDGKTERQLMYELGYHRYYDSGKTKWTLAV